MPTCDYPGGMSAKSTWEPPSPHVAKLIRTAAEHLLANPAEVFAAVDAAVLTDQPGRAEDPEVVGAIRASNRANMAHWALANIRDPGRPVPPNLGPDVLDIAREVVRRGFDDTMLTDYRTGQDAAWRHWMGTAFGLADDSEQLRAMLDITYRSISAFIDETLAVIHQEMARERAQIVAGSHTERLEVVRLILDGAPITAKRASARLRYELARGHTALVLWSDESEPPRQGVLERVAESATRVAGGHQALLLPPTPALLWAWIPNAADAGRITTELTPPAGVRIAIGTTADGIDGFRHSHLDALTTQRLMRRITNARPIASYLDVQLVALAARDEDRATQFVTRTLGTLAHADPELRETLRVYIRAQFSAAEAARQLYTHRNTVLNRVNRAAELLPVPLADNGLEVGLALELLYWLGLPTTS